MTWCVADPTHRSFDSTLHGARGCLRVRIAPWLLIAALTACDEGGSPMSADDESAVAATHSLVAESAPALENEMFVTVLAQVQAPSNSSPATAAAQDTARVASSIENVTFAVQFDEGCPIDTVSASTQGRLEVYFQKFEVKRKPSDTSPYDSKTCTLNVRMVAAQNVRATIQSIGYNGIALLPKSGSNVALRFESALQWFGATPGRSNHVAPIPVPTTGSWESLHPVGDLHAVMSSCPSDTTESDRLKITTSLFLQADPPTIAMGAFQQLTLDATAAAAGIQAPRSAVPPRMLIDVKVQRCP